MDASVPDSAEALATITKILAETPDALFAVLVGSRADGSAASEGSDWDIAIQWRHGAALERVGKHELLRHRLANALALPDGQVDLIDLANARLAMKALVAEEGKLLLANDMRAWMKFLTRTWRELEDFYWERTHAA